VTLPLCGDRNMSSYIVAGKADDPSFARAEYVAKQIETACPGVFFRFEMKHPDSWKKFIVDVFKKYDFDGYTEEFGGPLIWTHEGDLVGGITEFVQRICVEKFGMPNPPSVTDPIFKQIAADNLKQVKQELHRKANGPPFAELVETIVGQAGSSGFLVAPQYDERRSVVVSGAPFDVWISSALTEERAKLREDYGNGQPVRIDVGLQVTHVGPEQTHLALLHPRPLVRKHLVIPKRRHVREIVPEESADGAVTELEVPPSAFGGEAGEDLLSEDFVAAMEVLISVGGIATFMGLKRGPEYRHPLDTHIQVLPFPLQGTQGGEDCPRRYPLELQIERALRDGETSLKAFSFKHMLVPVVQSKADAKNQHLELAKAVVVAFEAARGTQDSYMLVFTTTWLLLAPLAECPKEGEQRYDAWLRLPPPPPCALAGVVVAEAIRREYPETAGLPGQEGEPLVSNRAVQEGLPEGSPEYGKALCEARISARILDVPAELIAVWMEPKA